MSIQVISNFDRMSSVMQEMRILSHFSRFSSLFTSACQNNNSGRTFFSPVTPFASTCVQVYLHEILENEEVAPGWRKPLYDIESVAQNMKIPVPKSKSHKFLEK